MNLSQFQKRVRSSSLVRDAGWMMAGQCLGYIFQAVYFVVLARLLGVVEYGIFVGAFAFVNLVGRYSTLGSGPVLLRYVSVDKSRFALYWGNMLTLSILGGVLLTVVMHLTGRHFLNPASASIVLLAALSNCLGMQIMMCSAQIFQAMERMSITAALNLLANFLRTIAATAMLLIMHRANAYQWALTSTAVSLVGAVVAVSIVLFCFRGPRFSFSLLRNRLFEGLEFAFASSTTSAYNDLDKVMLSHYGMNAANGIYTLAYRAVDIATMPVVSIRDAAMPKLYRKGVESLSQTSDFAGTLWKRSFPIALLAAVAMFLGAPLVPIIAGNSFAEVVPALRWLCLIPLFRSVHEIAGSALTAAGLQRLRTGTQIAALSINIGLNLWLIPGHGWRGAAWASLVTDGSLGFLNWNALRLIVTRERKRKLCSTVNA